MVDNVVGDTGEVPPSVLYTVHDKCKLPPVGLQVRFIVGRMLYNDGWISLSKYSY